MADRMSDQWRIIVADDLDYADIAALRVALLKLRSRGRIPNTVVVAQPSRPSLAYGAYLDPDKHLDTETCRRLGVPFVRTLAGGGVGFADPGILLCGIWFDERHPIVRPTTEATYRALVAPLAARIGATFGIDARYRPLNDLEIRGADGVWRKPGFTSFSRHDGSAYLLIGLQVRRPYQELMSRLIMPPKEKFADKQTTSVATRSTWLDRETGHQVPVDDVRQLCREYVERNFDAHLEPDRLTDAERDYCAAILADLTTVNWLYDRSERHRFPAVLNAVSRGRAIRKMPSGPLVEVVASVTDGRFRDVLINATMTAFPFPPVSPVHLLEVLLQGVEVNLDRVCERVRMVLDLPGFQIAGVSIDDLADLIVSAGERAANETASALRATT